MTKVVRRSSGGTHGIWNFKQSAHVAHTDRESLYSVVHSLKLFSLEAVIVQLVLLVMLHVGLPATFHPHGG